MASIVAYIDVREGAITPSSLFAIGESRRIAQGAGATVYGFLAVGQLSHVEVDQLAEQISAAGADRILCSAHETLAGPALDLSHGAVLAQLAEHLRPLLFLFPAGGVGSELGPPLAVRIGAAYVPAASIDVHALEIGQEPVLHRVFVSRWRAARDGLRRIDVGDLERPVVAVLAAGAGSEHPGESYAEVEMIPCPSPKHIDVRLLRVEADPGSEVESCRTLVCAPAATEVAEIDELRKALPADARLRSDDACDIGRAAPQDVLLLSLDRAQLPIRAHAVLEVSGTAADLAAALHRLHISDGGAPA
jgi:electron transfer flavoprotein alpha subunit